MGLRGTEMGLDAVAC